MMLGIMFLVPSMMSWAQEMNEKFSMTTQIFLNELRESANQPVAAPRRAPGHKLPDGRQLPKLRRLIASPDTVGNVVYISCFIHLKDVNDLSEVRSLDVEIEETFDELGFVTARVPVDQLEPLAEIDNVTKIRVAQCMRPTTDVARQKTNVDDLLTLSNDATAAGVTELYDGTGVVLGVIDTGIDFQHIAFKDKDGNSRIKRAYIYNGTSATEYTESNISSATTDDNSEDHGTHTATTAGGSSVIVSGSTVTVTDNHTNATYGGMAPGADLYLAGIKELSDTYLSNALKKMVTYADDQGKPLVVSNSWGSSWGSRTGTGDWADLVATYFGDSHPNHIILFAASNDAGHTNGSEGGGYFVKKSSVSSSNPLGTIIRTDGEGGNYYIGLIACAWNASNSTELNCKLHVLNSSGTILKSWTVTTNGTSSFSGLSDYYSGSMTVYIEQENGKYRLALYSEDGIESTSSGSYTLAIEVYPSSGSANINMWSGDWSFFTDNYTTSSHTWLDGTDDMCVSDEATIPNAISVGAYVSKKSWKASNGSTYTSNVYTVGDIAYFSSYATAAQSPTGVAYPWISAPGARLAAGVNHYHTTSVDDYSYYGSDYGTDLVVNNSNYPYAMMEGTSMATPVAAGIVALWLQAANSVNTTLTVNQVKEIMEQTAITDSYTNGANASHFGKGKIDALAGIQYILASGGPTIRATPSSIDFGSNGYATLSYTQTLNVKGFNLEGGINATLSDANGVYSLSQTSITRSAAADGVDITITYAPQSAGTHEATITLTSSNATNVVVPLTATAKAATPTIVADPETLSFKADLSTSKSLTFDVLTEFLTNDVTVTLSDANNVFSVDKTSITKVDSEEGATVTVTFQSATAGTFNGTVTLSSAGADPVVVTLTGIAATTSEEAIDFTAQGYSNQQAVTSVSGTDCTVAFDKGTNSNAPTYYSSGSAIRIYGGNTMTVASTTKTIVGIELTFGSSDGSNAITTDVESYSNGTWTGSASSVTFTVGGTSGNRRIQSVKVTYAGGTTPVTKQDVTMAFSPTSATATVGEDFTEPTLTTTPSGLTVTYSSSNTDVATVNSSTGEVTLVAAGTTTITASFAGNDSYNAGSASYTLTVNAATNTPGTQSNPYTVAQAIAYINTLGTSTSPSEVYVSGIVSQVDSYNSNYKSITYWISDDGTTTTQMEVYSGKGLNSANFSSVNDLQQGDVVTVCGNVKMYNSTPEFNYNNYLVAFNRPQKSDVTMSFSPSSVELTYGDAFVKPTLTTDPADLTVTYESSNTNVATVDASGDVTIVGAGTATITATFAGNNSYNEGSASYTITVNEAVTLPEMPDDVDISSVSSTSFTVSWEAMANATSYDIDVVQGSYFDASSSVAVLESDFSDTSDWTLSGTGTYTSSPYIGSGSPSIKFDGTGDYAISPDFGSGTKLQFWAYGNGGAGSSFAISGLVNSTWTNIETVTIAQGGNTYEVNLPAGTSQVRFDFTKSVNCALDDVIVYGAGGTIESLTGYPKSVGNVTSYTVTDLTPETQYSVRVRAANSAGNSDWSATVTATTSSQSTNPVVAYYQPADGKQGSALKTAMCVIILPHTQRTYENLWTDFQSTDVHPDGDKAGKIWDMYSNTTNYDPNGSHTNSGEGDGFNREHSFPKSWFGGENVMPMFTDLHHIYPTDSYINGRRSNYPYGETDGETYKSNNDFSKLGTCTYPGYTGKVFEPADEYKGDFARTYFYMVTCYENELPTWVSSYSSSTDVEEVLDGSTYPAFTTWTKNMLMEWAKNDPVSEKETNRNNAVYAIQGNRNPFIDYPGLQEYIWGFMTTSTFSYDNYQEPVYTTKQDVTMAFSPATATATVGQDFTEPTLSTTPSGLTVTYSSSNTSVATVDAGTGEVTLVAAGTTTITATFAGNDTYNSGSASYELTVSASGSTPVTGSGSYALVTDASTLAVGDKILIAYVNGTTVKAMSATQGTNNRAAVDVTKNNDDTLAPGSDAQVITLGKDGNNFLFNVGADGYLYAASSSSNWLRTEESADNNAKATISIASSGNATITFQGSNTRNLLRYNSNDNLFSCYGSNSNMALPQIYRETAAQQAKEDVTMSFSPATASATMGENFTAPTLTTTPSGLTVTYSSSNTSVATVDENTGAVTLVAPGETTITASFAGNSSYNSGSASYTLTVNGVNSILLSESSKTVAYADGAFTLTATVPTVNYNGTVSAESSNTYVATVAVDGTTITVTPVAVGTATITVTAGTDTYYPAEASAECTVTFTAPAGGTTAPSSTSDYTKITSTDDLTNGEYLIVYEGDNTHDAVAFNGGLATLDAGHNTIDVTISGSTIGGSDDIDGATFVITAVTGGYSIRSASGHYISGKASYDNGMREGTEEAFVNGISFVTGNAVITSATTSDDVSLRFNYSTGDNNYRFRYYKSGQQPIALYKKVATTATTTVSLNMHGYATYCSVNPIDFSDTDGYTAWRISDISNDGTITFEKITEQIKGGQGVLLYNKDADGVNTSTATITFADGDTEFSDAQNRFVGTTAPTYVASETAYGLSTNKFVKNNVAGVIPAGKAYIPAAEIPNNVRAFTFVFSDPITGISETQTVSPEEFGAMFNLAGQRISQPQKGVIIVNGKKILVR